MAEKWSLLEFMSAQMGCEYLSDFVRGAAA